ncbi:MAG: recombinase family protein [Tepidanaerobacteraceae bacterium]
MSDKEKEVIVIEPSNNKIDRRNSQKIERLRVAAYCRVSTGSEEQLESYQSQVRYYKDKITSNSNWELVGIYADEGLSGTQVKWRQNFQRMIDDALAGKIDLIITKSISRFARNTLDTLKYVRLLRERNIAVYFEKENINTLDMAGELLLTILSSLAQAESESISKNVRIGLKMKMRRGEMVGFNGCLGYDYDPTTKTLSINEEEAKTVRYIFKRYTEGAGCFTIAKELTRLKFKTKLGNTVWHESSVRRILKNEKYVGDLILGKTFTQDPISKRRLENFGEEEKYYIRDNHEAIISRELFEKAQEILQKRSGKHSNKGQREKYSRKYAFSSMVQCGFCGSHFTRRTWHAGSEYEKIMWSCVTSINKGKKNCIHSKRISEEDLCVWQFKIP